MKSGLSARVGHSPQDCVPSHKNANPDSAQPVLARKVLLIILMGAFLYLSKRVRSALSVSDESRSRDISVFQYLCSVYHIHNLLSIPISLRNLALLLKTLDAARCSKVLRRLVFV